MLDRTTSIAWLSLFLLFGLSQAKADDRDIMMGLGMGIILSIPELRVVEPNGTITRFTGEHGTRASVRTVQTALTALGFDTGTFDGVAGPRTRQAVKKYQAFLGREPTGMLDDDETKRLMTSYTALLERKQRDVPARQVSRRSAAPAGTIFASRLFAGPEDFPPTDFAAYGILAFKTQASSDDRARHLMICRAYRSSIRSFDELPIPKQQQMVTVWPISTGQIAEQLTSGRNNNACEIAVDNYGSVMADQALRQAKVAGAPLKGLGPYLLAWSPPQKKGQPDAIVLVADLSEVETYDAALAVMLDWVESIERDPTLWSAEEGWTIEDLRVKVQHWFDRRGTQLLSAVGKG